MIETEVGKSFENDDDLKKFARLLILEAAGKLPPMPKPIPKENVSTPSRKRTLVEESVEVQEATKKKGRRSLAVPSPATPVVKSTPRSRRSMMPQIPTVKNTEPEPTGK